MRASSSCSLLFSTSRSPARRCLRGPSFALRTLSGCSTLLALPPRYSVLEHRGVKGDGGNPPLPVTDVVLCSQLYIVSHHKPPTLGDRHPKVLEGHAELRPRVETRVALPTPQRAIVPEPESDNLAKVRRCTDTHAGTRSPTFASPPPIAMVRATRASACGSPR